MKYGMMVSGMMVSGLVCLLGGCIDGAGPAPGAADEPLVERTIVKLLPGGTSETRTEQVSAAQIRREIAARAARIAGVPQVSDGTGEVEQEVASLDSCSDGRAMWIFDSENHMLGTGLFSHEICFIKTSSDPPICADLRNYTRVCFAGGGCQRWAGDTGNWIGSYWAGVDDGYFSDTIGATQGGFGPFQFLDNAETQLSRANHLCFRNPP